MAAASGIDDMLPETALAVALVALDEVNQELESMSDIEIEQETKKKVSFLWYKILFLVIVYGNHAAWVARYWNL